MHTAKLAIAALERAQIRAKAPDARRILSDERCKLMSALQEYKRGIGTADELTARVKEARKTMRAWSKH